MPALSSEPEWDICEHIFSYFLVIITKIVVQVFFYQLKDYIVFW